jgi:hypothetical protein
MLNPWSANRYLRERVVQLNVELALERETVDNLRDRLRRLEAERTIERDVIVSLRKQLANVQPRDPKTGRMLPKGR